MFSIEEFIIAVFCCVGSDAEVVVRLKPLPVLHHYLPLDGLGNLRGEQKFIDWPRLVLQGNLCFNLLEIDLKAL
jgi:hypothetical protein